MELVLDDLDAAGLLAASTQAVRTRRLAEVADLETLAQWAAIHSEDPLATGDKIRRAQARIQGNLLRQLGATARRGCRTSASARSRWHGRPAPPRPATHWPLFLICSTGFP